MTGTHVTLPETHTGRTYRLTNTGICEYCPAAATWDVTEDETGEGMLVCSHHKYVAFS